MVTTTIPQKTISVTYIFNIESAAEMYLLSKTYLVTPFYIILFLLVYFYGSFYTLLQSILLEPYHVPVSSRKNQISLPGS